jgi:hypothetical protein
LEPENSSSLEYSQYKRWQKDKEGGMKRAEEIVKRKEKGQEQVSQLPQRKHERLLSVPRCW